MKVAILESLSISKEELNKRKAPFEKKGVEFVEFEKSMDKDMLIDEAKDAEAVIIANMPFKDEVIEGLDHLKFIDVAFTGVDHVGLKAAKEKGISVSNASGYSNEAVSELVFGMVISIARNIRQTEERCREGKTKDGLVGWEIKGKTVGIIGHGRIGKRTAELLNYDPVEQMDRPEYIEQTSVEDLLGRSDIVVLHCPLIDSTKGLIDAKKLSLMKKTAILINVARGPVVNAKDLADALNNEVIAGAGIDVFDCEPPLPEDEPLLHCKNILLTPHIAFASEQSMSLRAEIVFDNLAAWMEGRQQNVIL